MDNVISMDRFIGAAKGDEQQMLGKFLYFSLANLLVDREELSTLCESVAFPMPDATGFRWVMPSALPRAIFANVYR